MQNILRNMLPRLLDSLTQSAEGTHNRSLVQHTLGSICSLRGLLAQTLGTTPAAVVRKHLIGNLVIRLELGIFLLHLLPNRLALLHQLHHVLPLLRVRLPQCLSPQVSILVDRRLARRYTRVNVYLATNSITISITVRRAEETHLVPYLQILVVEDNIVPIILVSLVTGVMGCMHLKAGIAKVVQKLRGCLVRAQIVGNSAIGVTYMAAVLYHTQILCKIFFRALVVVISCQHGIIELLTDCVSLLSCQLTIPVKIILAVVVGYLHRIKNTRRFCIFLLFVIICSQFGFRLAGFSHRLLRLWIIQIILNCREPLDQTLAIPMRNLLIVVIVISNISIFHTQVFLVCYIRTSSEGLIALTF